MDRSRLGGPGRPELPPSLPNTTPAPTVFEEGDTTAPTVDLISIKTTDNDAPRSRSTSPRPARSPLRLKLGKKVVATETVDVNAGQVSAQIKPPKDLRDKERKYKLQVFATDMAEIDSEIHSVWVYPRRLERCQRPISVRTSSSSGKNVRSSAARRNPTPEEPPVPRL